MRFGRIPANFIHSGRGAILVSVVCAAGIAVAQDRTRADGDYNALLHAAVEDEARGDFKGALSDLTRAIAAAHGWVELSEAYKFRADVEKHVGDVNAAMQDEANADYIALGWDANPPLPDTPPPTCAKTAAVAESGTPYRAYSGCALPQGQTGVVRLIGLRARYVDGRPLFNAPLHGKSDKSAYVENSNALELPPGFHSILFILPAPVCSLPPLLTAMCPKETGVLYTNLSVASGKAYTAVVSGLSSSDWIPVIEAIENTMNYSPSPTWDLPIWRDGSKMSPHHVEIEEQQANPVAYLRIYEGNKKNGSDGAALAALRVSLALFPKNPDRTRVEHLANDLIASLQRAEVGVASRSPAKRSAETPNPPSCKSEAGNTKLSETEGPETTDAGNYRAEDLEGVLLRAQDYVERYQVQLGSLLGQEVYIQNAASTDPAGKTQRQRTESDYALRQVGRSWVGVRDVNCVNGKPAKSKMEDFEKVLESPGNVNVATILERITAESAAVNIGDFRRTTNEPTFGLQVLYRENSEHFEFQKSGETRIGDAPVWIINFREIQGPTLVSDGDGRDQFSYGTLWIEPETGRVRKTEMNAPHTTFPVFVSRTIVLYQNSERLGMLVPAVMDEHYDSDYAKLDCHAEYYDFHRFDVQTHFDFGAPPPVKPPGPEGRK